MFGHFFSKDEMLVCENLTLALDYKFYWRENGITGITLTRTIGTIILNSRGKCYNAWPLFSLTNGSD